MKPLTNNIHSREELCKLTDKAGFIGGLQKLLKTFVELRLGVLIGELQTELQEELDKYKPLIGTECYRYSPFDPLHYKTCKVSELVHFAAGSVIVHVTYQNGYDFDVVCLTDLYFTDCDQAVLTPLGVMHTKEQTAMY